LRRNSLFREGARSRYVPVARCAHNLFTLGVEPFRKRHLAVPKMPSAANAVVWDRVFAIVDDVFDVLPRSQFDATPK
jgi:hypothetical protein